MFGPTEAVRSTQYSGRIWLDHAKGPHLTAPKHPSFGQALHRGRNLDGPSFQPTDRLVGAGYGAPGRQRHDTGRWCST